MYETEICFTTLPSQVKGTSFLPMLGWQQAQSESMTRVKLGSAPAVCCRVGSPVVVLIPHVPEHFISDNSSDTHLPSVLLVKLRVSTVSGTGLQGFSTGTHLGQQASSGFSSNL